MPAVPGCWACCRSVGGTSTPSTTTCAWTSRVWQEFLDRHDGQPVLLFGFTFMVWKHFLQAIRESGATVDLSQGVLIHSGGWKKLAEEAVGNAEFKAALREATGLRRVHNFYGMVEQVGSVFLEGDDGFLYPPNFADVIIRDPRTWGPAPHGTPGVVEVLSVLPHSYPGHVLLTEDLGIVHGVGDPASGWSGKQLEIIGRVPRRNCGAAATPTPTTGRPHDQLDASPLLIELLGGIADDLPVGYAHRPGPSRRRSYRSTTVAWSSWPTSPDDWADVPAARAERSPWRSGCAGPSWSGCAASSRPWTARTRC